jgi:hypothetical protein
VVGLALVLSWLSLAGRAPACATAFKEGNPVAVAGESAIIIWDAPTRTQHFIRRASFDTAAADFGFLVPTPTKPYLGESSDEAFASLESLTAPEIITKVVPRPDSKDKDKSKSAAKSGDVEILGMQRVAGFDAVVLRADDAAALNQWLKKHGYSSRPALTEWLETYVKAKWILTAFKIAKKEDGSREVSTAAVRMSFQTDRPFFPYREPADQTAEGGRRFGRRLLRVFFIGDARMVGQLGKSDAPWPGRVVWANRLAGERQEALTKQLNLGADAVSANSWLTVLEDASSPRPGTDELYFVRATEQTTLARPPHVKYVYEDEVSSGRTVLGGQTLLYVSGGVGILLAGVAVVLWRKKRIAPA